jgi:hypothetical protein
MRGSTALNGMTSIKPEQRNRRLPIWLKPNPALPDRELSVLGKLNMKMQLGQFVDRRCVR